MQKHGEILEGLRLNSNPITESATPDDIASYCTKVLSDKLKVRDIRVDKATGGAEEFDVSISGLATRKNYDKVFYTLVNGIKSKFGITAGVDARNRGSSGDMLRISVYVYRRVQAE